MNGLLALDEEELEVGWAAQKVSNFLFMLSVVRTLVSPSNTTQVKIQDAYCLITLFITSS